MKRTFKETIRYFKKFKDNWYIQFLNDKVYLSDAHFVISMDKDEYSRYIMPKISLPAYKDDTKYTICKGEAIEHKSSFSFADRFMEVYMDDLIDAKVLNILIDTDNAYARGIVWDDKDHVSGLIINDWFYEISKEHGVDGYHVTDKKSPVLTRGLYDGTGMIILPIHYTDYSTFGEILEGMNAVKAMTMQKYVA